ncbi:MAG TPA: DMT family transporter [Gaiellaceae bacterium]|nr:DMT family transporter [Gaiellaceae bacterium]
MATVLALVAAFLFAVAATFQQRGALDLGLAAESLRSFLKLARSWWWLGGTAVLLAGYAAQAIALDHGRVSIVQPLLVTTIVFALPLGVLVTAQQVGRREIVGAVVVVAGLALYAVFGDPAGGKDNASNGEWAVALALVALASGVLLLLGRNSEHSRRAALFGVVAGILFGTSACLAKPTLELLDSSVTAVLSSWEFYGMAVTGIAAFVLQQVSLSEGFLATSVATVSTFNPIVSVLFGILLFDERLSDPRWHKFVAVAGMLLAMGGAFAISKAREGAGELGGAALERPEPDARLA